VHVRGQAAQIVEGFLVSCETMMFLPIGLRQAERDHSDDCRVNFIGAAAERGYQSWVIATRPAAARAGEFEFRSASSACQNLTIGTAVASVASRSR